MDQAYELDILEDGEVLWQRVPRRCRDFEEAKHLILGLMDYHVDTMTTTFAVRLRKVP